MERFERDSIQQLLTLNGLLNNAQHGFMPNWLLFINLFFSSLVDTKQKVNMIYLDLSMLFNVLNHQ